MVEVKVFDFLKNYEATAKTMEPQLHGITGKLQFDFTEDNNGCWCFELIDGKVQPIVEGQVEDATMTIVGAYETFYGVKTGKLDHATVMGSGELKVSGDTNFTMKLRAAGLV